MDLGDLPDDICSHILSFLPTKEAAYTSVLSRKWRYLFAHVPSLDLDDSRYFSLWYNRGISTGFMDFVDRVLTLQGDSVLEKFSLKVRDGVDRVRIVSWIQNVLERGVSDLDLHLDLRNKLVFVLPSMVYQSKTLVRLKLYFWRLYVDDVHVHVHLPNLKSLDLKSVSFGKHGVGLTKLLSGCPVLEELVLNDISWFRWDFASVSSSTLKRLRIRWRDRNKYPKSVSFDTPNLVYLKYTDSVAGSYPTVNFDSLVEAHIDLCLLNHSRPLYAQVYGENATDFIMKMCNVKTLYLSSNTLEVLTYGCDAIPIFNNLTQLTIKSSPKVGWQSLPGLLKNAPNLETLIFNGLSHKATDRCGDVCLCKPREEEAEIPSCLSSSPVKFIKVLNLGVRVMEKEGMQIMCFMETMPNLEKIMLYDNTPVADDTIFEIATRLQLLDFSKVASSKCIVQLISKNLSFSSTVLTNGHFRFYG